jgi:hypothetical protein
MVAGQGWFIENESAGAEERLLAHPSARVRTQSIARLALPCSVPRTTSQGGAPTRSNELTTRQQYARRVGCACACGGRFRGAWRCPHVGRCEGVRLLNVEGFSDRVGGGLVCGLARGGVGVLGGGSRWRDVGPGAGVRLCVGTGSRKGWQRSGRGRAKDSVGGSPQGSATAT